MNELNTIDARFFSDVPRPMSFFIVRHGETAANAERRIQGRSEYPLNDNGRTQAIELVDYLSEKNISCLVHSPQLRAAQTANILCSSLGLSVPRPEPLLAELDTGLFTGLTWNETRERFPEESAAFSYRSWEAVPGAEKAEDLYLRAARAWKSLKETAKNSTGNLVAVSHGGTIQWLVRVTFGCRQWMPLLTTGNCGVFELFVNPAGEGNPAYIHWRTINALPEGALPRIPPVF
ncbi:MAG: histidine phosphatase family protein [Spirochaetia bacterium]|jgi:broad specificity phosphatase PhoE|nr:histidine phosphatase family protein [Spirochaetia bacterium]